MRVDHAVAPHAEREDILAAAWKGARRQRQFAFPVLFGKDRRPRRNAPENRHGPQPRRPTPLRQRECAGSAPEARPSLQHSLALERTKVVESRPRCHVEPLADLTNGRGHAMTARKVTDEIQDVTLPAGQLAHGGRSLDRGIYSTPVETSSFPEGGYGEIRP